MKRIKNLQRISSIIHLKLSGLNQYSYPVSRLYLERERTWNDIDLCIYPYLYVLLNNFSRM